MEHGTPPPEQPHPVPDAALRVAQAEAQQAIQRNIFGVGLQFGPPPNPLLDKFDSENIKQLLTSADNENVRKHTTQRMLFGSVIVAVLVLCAIFLWAGKSELLEKILALLFGFAAGWAGGYGYGKFKPSES